MRLPIQIMLQTNLVVGWTAIIHQKIIRKSRTSGNSAFSKDDWKKHRVQSISCLLSDEIDAHKNCSKRISKSRWLEECSAIQNHIRKAWMKPAFGRSRPGFQTTLNSNFVLGFEILRKPLGPGYWNPTNRANPSSHKYKYCTLLGCSTRSLVYHW